MLADDLIAYVQADEFKVLLPTQKSGYYAMVERVRKAQRYVLNRDATFMVHTISESSPKRFHKAMSICRLPFPVIWIEFSYHDRSQWMQDAIKRGMTITHNPEASDPVRLGFLMEQDANDPETIYVQLAWMHSEMKHHVSISNLSLEIYTGSDERTISQDIKDYLRETKAGQDSKWRKWMNDPEEFAAGCALESRISEHVPDAMGAMWAQILKLSEKDREYILQMARFDLRSEWRFTLALLTVLNSRNIIDYGPSADLSKINKARIKNYKQPLLTHREIKLMPSRVQRNRIGTHVSGKDFHSHLVTGHFKLRSSGLFWWTPHIRGTKGMIEPVVTYTVKG